MSNHRVNNPLEFHFAVRPGKIEVVPTKPCREQQDLTFAYSPGVAQVCKAIVANPDDAYKYTGKGNLVAVASNGTAVLGLGNIGPLAGKPVMEGKGVLFKVFGDVDVFDLNIAETDPDKFCDIVKSLEPTFGGINLEDIKAPECFYIEDRLKKEMNIPVFHDDQHGTAIITGAALLNAMELTHKDISNIRVVVCGAGAAAIACSRFYCLLGVSKNNIAMFDSKGHINTGRTNLGKTKEEFATAHAYSSLAEAMVGADVFLGLSAAGMVTKAMVMSMAVSPVIFACANPDPEIDYPTAKATRADLIMGTGRSDYPNQINNVSCFPYIFRGALDVRATAINEEMKLAAAKAIAALAKEPVPEYISKAYHGTSFSFGADYVIPTPFDKRLSEFVSYAVAEAAIKTGVAQQNITLSSYKEVVRQRLTSAGERMDLFLQSYGW